jgi:dTDP-4-dehydrorhamnose 3,5-epimerase
MQFREGPIDGVIWKPLTFWKDQRGWLCELFRHDELAEEFHPVMAYISMTERGARGPHEHVDQADYFCFIGPSNFKVYLWTIGRTQLHLATRGKDRRRIGSFALLVPAGVVHAYQNVGQVEGIVFNVRIGSTEVRVRKSPWMKSDTKIKKHRPFN